MAFSALASSSASGSADTQLALTQAEAIADMAQQAALTAGATQHCPPANGALRDASDSEMSEASPDEVAARQALLDSSAREFLQAQDTGILNPEGETLYSDDTWRPQGYDSFVAPPVAEHFRISTPPGR